MSQFGSWSVKGVDDRARAVAKEKARLKGVTLGDYINNLLLDGHSEAGPRDLQQALYQQYPGGHAQSMHHNPPPTVHHNPLDSLAQRIEAVEARSTLAITGIDQSVLGMLARLEGTENSTAAMAAEVEAMIDQLRETHESLHEKVDALESDNSGAKSLEAMKALEDALGKLAAHVYEESRLTQDESAAVKGRVEAGFNDLNDRVEGVEIQVESTLASAAQRVEKAVEQAELRAEGTSRHLSERFSAIESSVAAKLSKVDQVDSRMKAVEGDVSGAITSMESTLSRIQERLNRAETTTDTALKALEQTFANLDERIDTVAEFASPEKADALRQELEQRFDELAADLRASVDLTRQKLASEIETAAARANPELVGELESRISSLEAENPAELVEGLGDQMARLSSSLDQRIVESESRSAAAIEQVGEQVASAIKHVQARQEQGQRELNEKIDAVEERQSTSLSDALNNVSDRLSEMQAQTNTAVSPVQKAIVSLAARLEALEDFNAPPLTAADDEALADVSEQDETVDPFVADPIEEPELIPDLAAFADAAEDTLESDTFGEVDQITEPEGAVDEESLIEAFADDADTGSDFTEPTMADEEIEDYDFIAGLPDFDDEPDVVGTEELAPETPPTEDWPGATSDEDAAFLDEAAIDETFEPFDQVAEIDADADPVEATDPLAELGSWDDTQHETRDSDIFAESDEVEALTAAEPEMPEEELAQTLDEELIEDDTTVLEPDDEATDYLSRARKAAIAAANDPSGESKLLGRRSAATSAARGGAGGRKIPVIAAASAFAIAAAGAGGWVALRGKTNVSGNDAQTIASASDVDTATAEQTAAEPTLGGIEFAEAASPIEETLFEAEGSVAGLSETLAEQPSSPEVTVDLPEIPKALTLERAAIDGDPVAQFKWGEDRLAAQDLSTGADFIRRSARQGLPVAQYRLAKLHERGLGVPRDFIEARNWTEKAAVGGNTKAMHDLAVFYADGEGGPQSYAAAAEWFRMAADFGVVDSQYNLAVLYENGLGISPSQAEALYWYEVAAANGDASAPGNVATLREALPLEQAQQAQRRAANWTAGRENATANGKFELQTWELSTQNQVATLQTVLNGLGYEAGTPDGIAGPGTRTAIEAYQADNGLEPSGVIDEFLIETLNRQTQSLAG